MAKVPFKRESNIKSVALKPVQTDKVDEKGFPVYEKKLVIEQNEKLPKISEVRSAAMKKCKKNQEQSLEQQ